MDASAPSIIDIIVRRVDRATSSSQRAVVARAARGPGGNRHRDDDASDGERAGADEASLVPYTVRVAKPPRFEDLGVHRLPKNTACGETIEVERGWFIVHRVTTMYNLVRGKYEKDGRRLDVQRAERFFVNARSRRRIAPTTPSVAGERADPRDEIIHSLTRAMHASNAP